MASLYEQTQQADPVTLQAPIQARRMRKLFLVMVDFSLLSVAFFAVYYWKRGTLVLTPMYLKLLVAMYGIWFVVSFSTDKFRPGQYTRYWEGVGRMVRCGIYLMYGVVGVVVLLGLYAFSRTQVFGACTVFMALEWSLFSLYYLWHIRPINHHAHADGQAVQPADTFSFTLAAVDFLLVGAAFFAVNYIKRESFYLLADYEQLILLIYGLWFVFAVVTRKFETRQYSNFYHAFWPWLKAGVLLFCTLALVVFLFRFTHFSRTQVFGPVVLLLILEAVLCALCCRFRRKRETKTVSDREDDTDGDMETALSAEEKEMLAFSAMVQTELPCFVDFDRIREALMAPVRDKLRDRVFRDAPAVFDFLDQTLDLSEIVQAEMVLRNSREIFRQGPLDDRSVRLLINLYKVNDFGKINQYFREAHNMLVAGGWFVGRAHTIQTHREWLFQKYPGVLARVLYAIDFVLHRAIPKIPRLNTVYFFLTRGKARVLSRAELLGRLRFCGFAIMAEKEIDQQLFFVVRKMLTPSVNPNPTYGPFVKLKRVGMRGEVLSIYKFRTMHPYSEFLQDYVYKINGLQKGGKLNNDFRVTTWGKAMRTLWLDELPMLYNWLKGDLKLFGVRPLSYQYLTLYPPALQVLRMKVKPGLVPPFYADMPESFEEICTSEKRYIQAYLKRPVRTQVRYFWRAVWNIVFKGARSR
ncbi:MAG: sugar transferase [Desulfobacteraceae bacterium]